jgi:hypothetical protein
LPVTSGFGMILMCPVRSYPRVSVNSTLGCQSVEPFRQSRECGDRLIRPRPLGGEHGRSPLRAPEHLGEFRVVHGWLPSSTL